MNNDYINFYNNLVLLTRNKTLYKDFINEDTFSDRMMIFFFHFAFFLNTFKSNSKKDVLQDVFDYTFKQLEISIREIGYGDASINKKMKIYINTFYSIIDKIERWETLDVKTRKKIFENYLYIKRESLILTEYFEKYRNYLKNNTFNSLLKGVIKLNF